MSQLKPCVTCDYVFTDVGSNSKRYYECHRNPPIASHDDGGAMWPYISQEAAASGCGQHEESAP
jgi:hypothetical protein